VGAVGLVVLHAAHHADLPDPVPGPGRPVSGEAVLAVKRLRARNGSTYSCLVHAAAASSGGPDMAIPASSPSRPATATRFWR